MTSHGSTRDCASRSDVTGPGVDVTGRGGDVSVSCIIWMTCQFTSTEPFVMQTNKRVVCYGLLTRCFVNIILVVVVVVLSSSYRRRRRRCRPIVVVVLSSSSSSSSLLLFLLLLLLLLLLSLLRVSH